MVSLNHFPLHYGHNCINSFTTELKKDQDWWKYWLPVMLKVSIDYFYSKNIYNIFEMISIIKIELALLKILDSGNTTSVNWLLFFQKTPIYLKLYITIFLFLHRKLYSLQHIPQIVWFLWIDVAYSDPKIMQWNLIRDFALSIKCVSKS